MRRAFLSTLAMLLLAAPVCAAEEAGLMPDGRRSPSPMAG
jgi:hypothetical protein